MATKKSAGTSKNGRDSNPKYLGVKIPDGGLATLGSIILRQRGSEYLAGKNVGIGKDDTLFALKTGKVSFAWKRKLNFNRTSSKRPIVSVE